MKVKRTGIQSEGPKKKQKLNHKSQKLNAKTKGKERASERLFISIPNASDQSDDENNLSEQDLEFFGQNAEHGGFLRHLDTKAIARSKKEVNRLHEMVKPIRVAYEDDLPSIHSHDEDEDSWNSNLEDSYISSMADSDQEEVISNFPPSESDQNLDSDVEMPYEKVPRKLPKTSESNEEKGIRRLPIKLSDGRVQYSDKKIIPRNMEQSTDDEEDEEEVEDISPPKIEDVSTGARFGRPAVADVIKEQSQKVRLQAAKEQIASICQDIITEPENGIGLLKRLHAFSLAKITTPTHPEPIKNDIVIRKLAILSQLVVFKDIIPGYRIRQLTDKEKAEKVSQVVQRTRDFEQGLVSVYQTYLRALQTELKLKNELSETALKCICQLLGEVTHFNFRIDLVATVVAHLCKRSWSESSDLCLQTLISVFRADQTGQPSLEIVCALNRVLKERKFKVHPDVLSCLLHLRLKTELDGVRASSNKAEHEKQPGEHSKGRAAARRAKGKATSQQHLSKRAQKRLKETKAIEGEMREADAEVDHEERANVQTETLKVLFVLYFSILKNPSHARLLSPALQGISLFAHLINVDFFKDLMQVLKDLMKSGSPQDEVILSNDELEPVSYDDSADSIKLQLQCIITAFELLTGQGESLVIDLHDFMVHLYSLIIPVSIIPGIETAPSSTTSNLEKTQKYRLKGLSHMSIADMLFHSLELTLHSSSKAASSFKVSSARRTAAFAKRLLVASLQVPTATALRCLTFVRRLLETDQTLMALLPVNTDDDGRAGDGVYHPDIEDPEFCNALASTFWELCVLVNSHTDPRVQEAAQDLIQFTPP